jgi:hypothetical protein
MVVLAVMCTGFEVVGPTRLVTGFPAWIGVDGNPSTSNRGFVRTNPSFVLAGFATSCQQKQAAQNDGCFHAHAPLAWLP